MRRGSDLVRTGLLVWFLAPLAARADGAFPDAMRILLPATRPQELILTTNFGLVISQNGGRSWSFLCEEAVAEPGDLVVQYQLGPAPRQALFARSSDRLTSSADLGCSWTAGQGDWTNLTDLFVDPTVPDHLFVLALVADASGTLASTLLQSGDGGRSFAPLYRAEPGVILTGVENAVAAPATIYLSATVSMPSGGVQPRLLRSVDGGKAFQVAELLAALGAHEPRIAAVDPVDPRTIYLRIVDAAGDQLAISHDGGETAAPVLPLGGDMSAFLRRSDGALLVGTAGHGAWMSRNGGKTFERWTQAPRLRGLGERAGLLYAVADNFQDGFAVASSSDGGASWTPVLRFADICAVAACASVCRGPLVTLMSLVGGGASCDGRAPEPPPDAAADVAVAGAKSGGCACAAGGGQSPGPGWLLAVGIAALVRRRAVRGARATASPWEAGRARRTRTRRSGRPG
jgi:MYXO-CTERM domain-containing protein